ncbi:Cobalt/zinc/cadmium efflux RND transporter,membrane fusion protein, CzcB family [Pseudoalteromonas luteoviolacea B = ATCC 29581]|nr:Cobalt/zinc/cadmium efflux RND transporter,membrane fusion protein, CzcB family [Pseudoalteromonas luteoviolacea B = ATCC 29581]
MNSLIQKLIFIFIGLLIGGTATWLFMPPTESGPTASEEKKPLYWVAPMDSNYRRDGPGKSPMGMDLVPVYEEDNAAAPGTVTIRPEVQNNLGVRTAKVTRSVLNHEIRTVGYVQYDEDSLIHIHPRVEGWIETLFVKATGEPVQANTPLYTLYSPELVNAQEEYLIALNRNNQALIAASKARLHALQLSSSFIDELAKKRQVKQSITFYTPRSGVVDGLQVREGFYVKPGNTILSIGQLDQVWVEVEVFERDAAKVALNQIVTMTLDFLPGRTWDGKVDYIYPTLDPKTRTLRVRLRFDNSDYALKPNMFASVKIHANTDQATLNVPKEAVIRTGHQDRVVLALGDGKFKSVAVSLGKWGNNQIEIIDGLNEDEEIVISAQFLIDSESSKTSDFKRMDAPKDVRSVWIAGDIRDLDHANRTATIRHDAVEEWQWPEMVMDFPIAANVNIDEMETGHALHFEATMQDDGRILVTGIHLMGMVEVEYPTAQVSGLVNAINTEGRIVNITRDAIEKWGREAATMDFIVAENVDLSTFKVTQRIEFTFEVRDDLVIVDVVNADAHAHH